MAAAANKFATRLRVFDPDGVAVPVSGSTTCDSAVTVTLSRPGVYTALVSACAAQLTGAYTLSLESRACPIALTIGNVVAPTDRMAAFRVFLHTLGQTVVAVQNDIDFGKAVPIAATDTGTPACRVNAKINKPDSTFAFRPGGCTPGVDCTGIRAVVFAAGNADPIADGSELYACVVHAQATAVIGTSYPSSVQRRRRFGRYFGLHRRLQRRRPGDRRRVAHRREHRAWRPAGHAMSRVRRQWRRDGHG
jgi:hypothetical protein